MSDRKRREPEFYTVGKVEDFPQLLGREVRIGRHEIAVFRTRSGAMYALENKSPHRKGGPLTEGMISGEYLFDPLYDLKICLRDGKVQEPDTGLVPTYPLRVEGGLVKIGIA